MANPRSKGRMLNKSISDSDGFASLSNEAAVLFCMLVPHYNPYGKMNGGAGYIKDEICPKVQYLTYENIPQFLQEITKKTSVKWFKHKGRCWVHSVNFLTEHQKLEKSKLGDDSLPSYSPTSPSVVVEESSSGHKGTGPRVEVEPLDEVLKTEASPMPGQSLAVASKEGFKTVEVVKNPNIKVFIDYAYQAFKDKYGIALHIDGKKDGSIIKNLLGTYPIETLKGLWDEYMRRYEGEEDSFLQQAGISIGVFKSQINKLLLKPPARQKGNAVVDAAISR